MWLLMLGIKKVKHLTPNLVVTSLVLGALVMVFLCMEQTSTMFGGVYAAKNLVAFVESETPETEVRRIIQNLLNHPQVDRVKVTTAETGLNSLSKFIGMPHLLETLDGVNPLPLALVITPKDNTTNTHALYNDIRKYPEILSIEYDAHWATIAKAIQKVISGATVTLITVFVILIGICLNKLATKVQAKISLEAYLCAMFGMSKRQFLMVSVSLGCLVGVLVVHLAMAGCVLVWLMIARVLYGDFSGLFAYLPAKEVALLVLIARSYRD